MTAHRFETHEVTNQSPPFENLNLFATDQPYSCPHGRPTVIRIGLPELERRFGRR